MHVGTSRRRRDVPRFYTPTRWRARFLVARHVVHAACSRLHVEGESHPERLYGSVVCSGRPLGGCRPCHPDRGRARACPSRGRTRGTRRIPRSSWRCSTGGSPPTGSRSGAVHRGDATKKSDDTHTCLLDINLNVQCFTYQAYCKAQPHPSMNTVLKILFTQASPYSMLLVRDHGRHVLGPNYITHNCFASTPQTTVLSRPR